MKTIAALMLVIMSTSIASATDSETPTAAPNTHPHGMGLLMDTDKSPVGIIYDHGATTT